MYRELKKLPDESEKSVVDGHDQVQADPRQILGLDRNISCYSHTVGGKCKQ